MPTGKPLASVIRSALAALAGLILTVSLGSRCTSAEAEQVAAPQTTPAPPYPQRSNPFKLPDSKSALATRREAVVQHLDLKLKGFVRLTQQKAVVEINGQIAALAQGERRGDIEVVSIEPPQLTLRRGRHHWTESLVEMAPAREK